MELIQQSAGSEDRNFKMHPELLWSVIQSQAGTPEKALLEAIMNAVDAGASNCTITITETGYSVQDDGHGFSSRTEIEEFFETFGTPHKEGDATYGRFRMGRGQLFAFSRTVWRSGKFMMDVDIKQRGLSYELQSGLENATGCTIRGTWYERIDRGELIRITHDLAQLAQWMQITVTLNDRKINKEPSEQKWALETADMYLSTKSAGGLAVYNLGALVRVYPSHQFGVSGILVSKVPLQVNFARNDILLSECKVWRRIRKELDKLCGNLTKKKSLYDFERDAIVNRFLRGDIPYDEISSLGLLIDVAGNKRSLNSLRIAGRVCAVFNRKDWPLGERLMNQKLAFVLRKSSLDRFGVETVDELITLLRSLVNITPAEKLKYDKLKSKLEKIDNELYRFYQNPGSELDNIRNERHQITWQIKEINEQFPHDGEFENLQSVSFDEICAFISDTYNLVDTEKLPTHKKAIISGLQKASETIADEIGCYRASLEPSQQTHLSSYREWQQWFKQTHGITSRRIVLGESDVAHAWTDGESFIAVNTKLVDELLKGDIGLNKMVAILVHEYCHDKTSQGGHVHDADFYELFHNIICDRRFILDKARGMILTGYAKAIAELGKKPNQVLFREIKSDSKLLGDKQDIMQGRIPEVSC